MEREAERLALDQGKEAVGAVVDPLQDRPLVPPCDLRLDERRPLAPHLKRKAVLEEHATVSVPGGGQSLDRVTEPVKVPRHPWRGEDLIESGPSGDVALARSDPVLG